VIAPASLSAPERRALLIALGEQLSRVPRRVAAAVALLSLLAVGGTGAALAAAHPRLATSVSGMVPRPVAPAVRLWEEHRDRYWGRRDPAILRRDPFAPPRGP